MPDFTLAELKDTWAILDVLIRMGDRAKDAGCAVAFYLQPGMAPVLRLTDVTLPAGRIGIDDPVHSAVPVPLIDPPPAARSAADFAADAASLPKADTEHPAAPKASLTQGGADDLPGHLLPAGQVPQAVTPPRYWTDEEDAELVETVAAAVATEKRGARADALRRLAAKLDRPLDGLTFRVKAKLGDRIAARVAELQQQCVENRMLGGEPGGLQRHSLAEKAPVQGVASACDGVAVAAPEAQQEQDASEGTASPALEQAGEGAASVTAPSAPAVSDAEAGLVPVALEQAGEAAEPDTAPPTPAAISSKAPNLVADDALTRHLIDPRLRHGWALATDFDLMTQIVAGIPAGVIATELGIQPHQVTLRFDRLTGLDRDTKARRFSRAAVADRLRDLVALEAAARTVAA